MLKKLHIQNFKVWGDTDLIKMAPITMFFGTNSSGKSSIGQFLMMLKQTIESSDKKAVFYLGGKNSAVQLGSYKEMVFHHDVDKKIAFRYEWDLNSILKFKDPVSGNYFSGDTLHFGAKVGLENKEQNSLTLNYLRYRLVEDGNENMNIGMERREGQRWEYKVDSENYPLKRKQGRVWYPGAPIQFYGFPDEVAAYHQNADFVRNFNFMHETLFRSLFYLGPLRTKAERLYSWSGIEPDSVGYSGENTVAAILAARNRKISLGRKRPAKPFEEIIALGLKQMGLIEDFKVNQISKQRQEYEVKVRTRNSWDLVDLPDVGFGVSQVLPVLVECFYAPRGSIIIMEQPEIHLHPSAQAALADVMIDVINSRENGADRNIQLIIETHSEHFLRRLQRRIAEDKISQEKVSAYFSDVTKIPSKLNPLEIDEYGNILNWPEDFFGDEMADITEHAKAAMRKRIEQSRFEAKDSE